MDKQFLTELVEKDSSFATFIAYFTITGYGKKLPVFLTSLGQSVKNYTYRELKAMFYYYLNTGKIKRFEDIVWSSQKHSLSEKVVNQLGEPEMPTIYLPPPPKPVNRDLEKWLDNNTGGIN